MKVDTDKIVKETYNKIALKYHQKWGKYSRFYLKCFKEFIEKLPQEGKILDLGCGTGRDAKWFSGKEFEVVGVDFSAEMLKIAKKVALKAKFIQKDIRNINFPVASFNGIWASFVLLHLKRREVLPLLKRIKKFLKPGGILFIATKKGKGEIIEPEHLDENLQMFETFFETKELENLIKIAGFKILKSGTDTDRKESNENIIIIYAEK